MIGLNFSAGRKTETAADLFLVSENYFCGDASSNGRAGRLAGLGAIGTTNLAIRAKKMSRSKFFLIFENKS
jgi:hypothetical protein